MKKLLIALLIVITLVMCACSTETDTGSTNTPENTPTIGQFTEADLIFSIDGEEFSLNSDVTFLLKAFGDDYTTTTAPSCAYDGEDKVFDYSFASIFTYPTDGKDLIDEIYIFDGDYQTNKGIKIGSTIEEVKAQYGEGGFLVDSSYFYVLSGNVEDLKSPKLYFDLEDDLVVGISYYSASNIIE